MTEQLDTWYGLALLLSGEDDAARERLRRAVGSMTESDRLLELPTAAVYLAEAEWRGGDETAADLAADVALSAAHSQGSNHVLLQALADFPFVVSRRIDTEPGADSAWHELGRALIAQGATVDAPVRSSIELHEFGRPAIIVDGVPTHPRINKTYELLAYLITRPGMRAGRNELLDALFDGRSDPSARAYLRQAIRWLRDVLGAPEAVTSENGDVSLADTVTVAGESARLEVMLADAERLAGEVLETEPFREAAWRLRMRLADALGAGDNVIRLYQACERALAELGTTPSRTTRALLERLRR